MRRSETEPLESLNLVDGFEQLHEGTLIVDLRKFMAAVQIHDLPKQRDFLYSAGNEIACFADDFFDRAAALGAARLRNDAKSAMHVAPLHDRDERGCLLRHELLIANRRLRSHLFGYI